jgi:hypothetical protein
MITNFKPEVFEDKILRHKRTGLFLNIERFFAILVENPLSASRFGSKAKIGAKLAKVIDEMCGEFDEYPNIEIEHPRRFGGSGSDGIQFKLSEYELVTLNVNTTYFVES